MNKLIIILCLLLLPLTELIGQCSDHVFALSEGTEWEMGHFNRKGKLDMKTRYKIVSATRSGGQTQFKVESTAEDEKGNPLDAMGKSFTITCDGDRLLMDFDMFVPNESYQDMPDAQVTITGDQLEYPAKMKVGQSLKDADVTIEVRSIINMNIDFTIKDRKIEAMEEIITEAGTFNCYKITSNTHVRTKVLNRESAAIDWIAEGVGTVRTETFNRRGRSEGYTELTYYKKGS